MPFVVGYSTKHRQILLYVKVVAYVEKMSFLIKTSSWWLLFRIRYNTRGYDIRHTHIRPREYNDCTIYSMESEWVKPNRKRAMSYSCPQHSHQYFKLPQEYPCGIDCELNIAQESICQTPTANIHGCIYSITPPPTPGFRSPPQEVEVAAVNAWMCRQAYKTNLGRALRCK